MFRFGDPGGRMYTAVGTSNINILAHWTNIQGTWSVSAGNGRTTGACLRAGGTNAWLSKGLDSQATWGVAMAFRTQGLGTTTAMLLIGLYDNASIQVGLYMNQDGSLSVLRGGATVLGTTAPLLSLNAYAHIELKAKIDSSVGTVQLWMNGSQKLNLTAQNTRASANSSANTLTVGLQTNAGLTPDTRQADFDDIIFYDGQTTDPAGNSDIVGPVGDCGLAWLLPTGAGTTTQFTPDTAVANYGRVNEATPDGDTSYVESSTVGQVDTYALADLPAATSAVKTLALCHYARKTDVGARQMGATLRTGGANFTHPTGVDLGSSYQYSFRNWGTNPGTVLPWTVADVNALEIGQTVNT
jgi:hypothetical protein